MPEDLFRIVITVAVILACIAFVVQAFVALALLRVVRKVREDAAPLLDKGEVALGKAAPIIGKIEPIIDRATEALEKAGPVLEKAGPAVEKAIAILATTQQIIDEIRPRISEVTTEAVAIAKSSREHVERLGDLVQETAERARTRIEQIDRSVDNTVEQVEHIGESVKQAALRPVREVNGIANGISAAVSTLVRGSRRSSVNDATQDEEMFI